MYVCVHVGVRVRVHVSAHTCPCGGTGEGALVAPLGEVEGAGVVEHGSIHSFTTCPHSLEFYPAWSPAPQQNNAEVHGESCLLPPRRPWSSI